MQSAPSELSPAHTRSRLCNKPRDRFTGLHQAETPAAFHRGALINHRLQALDPAFSLLMKRFILSWKNVRLCELGRSVTLMAFRICPAFNLPFPGALPARRKEKKKKPNQKN